MWSACAELWGLKRPAAQSRSARTESRSTARRSGRRPAAPPEQTGRAPRGSSCRPDGFRARWAGPQLRRSAPPGPVRRKEPLCRKGKSAWRVRSPSIVSLHSSMQCGIEWTVAKKPRQLCAHPPVALRFSPEHVLQRYPCGLSTASGTGVNGQRGSREQSPHLQACGEALQPARRDLTSVTRADYRRRITIILLTTPAGYPTVVFAPASKSRRQRISESGLSATMDMKAIFPFSLAFSLG